MTLLIRILLNSCSAHPIIEKSLTVRRWFRFPFIFRVSASLSNCCFQLARRASSCSHIWPVNIIYCRNQRPRDFQKARTHLRHVNHYFIRENFCQKFSGLGNLLPPLMESPKTILKEAKYSNKSLHMKSRKACTPGEPIKWNIMARWQGCLVRSNSTR